MPGEWPRVVIPIAMIMASERTGGQRQHRQTDYSGQHVFLGCQRPIPPVHPWVRIKCAVVYKVPKLKKGSEDQYIKQILPVVMEQ
jgi:hypothetical protein